MGSNSIWGLDQGVKLFFILSIQFKVIHKKILLLTIDFFHNGGQTKYSFVLMLISLSSLTATSKFLKNICFKMRPVALININTKECKGDRHL